MLDFLRIAVKYQKGVCDISPKFVVKKSSDLMIRGGDFYAIWVEEDKKWSTDEEEVIRLVDEELKKKAEEIKDEHKVVHYMWDADSGSIDRWHKYCQKQLRDNYHILDQSLAFSNSEGKKADYASKKLPYSLERGSIEAYDELISVLYSEEERHKLEWAIGAIVSGDSKHIQKFLVLYGSAGTGKSTVLNIIQKLFDGYWCAFDAKSIGGNGSFSLEPFKSFPLVGIQHDGDLSRIEDNTKLNSLVSHEMQPMNAKYEKLYVASIKAFLFMGTNKPVKITEAKSGLIRRLIDVSPTGNKLKHSDYIRLTKQIDFELGAIAQHCLEVYQEEPNYYNNYIPTGMMGASNDFYNFVLDNSIIFESRNGISLKSAWELYKAYCEDANYTYQASKRVFKEEFKNYYKEFYEHKTLEDGTRVCNYYETFLIDKFTTKPPEETKISTPNWLDLYEQDSIFDEDCKNCFAQYASDNETPVVSWDKCKSYLKELDTSRLHYVRVPENHIVIDLDLKDKDGNKDFALNLEAASKFPKTYVEVSKGGAGIHLHYIYDGDVSKLSRIYDDQIEVKIFTGKSSLRRKLTKCNNLPISHIQSGLPLKGDKKVIDKKIVLNEKKLIELIKRALAKEIHPGTKPNIDFIDHILNEAYDNNLRYDVSDLRDAVLQFAMRSTHQSAYCMRVVANMKFVGKNYISEQEQKDEPNIAFFDIEVFPNLLLICYKIPGDENPVISMINPTPEQVEELIENYDLIGFNNRKYDNHIIYARAYRGYSIKACYNLSQQLINEGSGYLTEAYNISETDIYDFCSEKMSLKKWEIKLGIHHKELGMKWDEPVPEDMWNLVAEYCKNDVIATEAVFNARQGDYIARKILVAIVKNLHGINATCNDTTNSLSQRIIFGNNRRPQSEFNYRFLADPVGPERYSEYIDKFGPDYKYRWFDKDGLPLYKDFDPNEPFPPEDGVSILPFFKGYTYDQFNKKGQTSTYLGESIGEGGRVYSDEGMYENVICLDVSSMHPSTMSVEVIFGPKFTKIADELRLARVAIKHKDFETAGSMLNGALKPFLKEELASDLAQALKIVINSIYGLTSAKFANAFRDPNNIDNIVAKRGALFMTLLKQEVEKKGYHVCHIKTDCIKINDADDYIHKFVVDFGKEYGYNFEVEHMFKKFVLINDSVYVGQTTDGEWVTVGKQFQVPYVKKKLFTKEDIEFKDLCETFAVSKGDLYLDFNENLPDVSEKEALLDKYEKLLAKENFKRYSKEELESSIGELKKEIPEGHNLIFVGRVGQFSPIKEGNNGGLLYRVCDGKNYAASGSTGYRWLESEVVKSNKLENCIDLGYYNKLVDDAVEVISKYGDFEMFVSDDDLGIKSDKLPF